VNIFTHRQVLTNKHKLFNPYTFLLHLRRSERRIIIYVPSCWG